MKDDDDLTLSCSDDDGGDDLVDSDHNEIKNHPHYQQVLLDVNRCAGRLEHIRQCYHHRTDEDNEPPEDLTQELESQKDVSDDDESICESETVKSNITASLDDNAKSSRIVKDLQYQRKLKKKLAKLIVRLLIKKGDLHYYQGFHDVCLTYMTLYGETEALEKLDQIIDTHFRAFMQPTMKETQEFLELIPMIIGLRDGRILDFLDEAEVGTIFALSWVLTWFSHVIPNERDVEKIFTYLEKNKDPHLILYLSAEIVLHKKEQLLKLEPEMSSVHHFLCQVPRKEKLPIDELLERASAAIERWPPDIVKTKLVHYRRERTQLQNYNLIKVLAQQFTSIVTSNSRTALVVFVVASALAFQFDRWMR